MHRETLAQFTPWRRKGPKKENAERKLGKGAATGRREIERAKDSEPKANFERDRDVTRKWSSCSIYLFFPQAKTSDTFRPHRLSWWRRRANTKQLAREFPAMQPSGGMPVTGWNESKSNKLNKWVIQTCSSLDAFDSQNAEKDLIMSLPACVGTCWNPSCLATRKVAWHCLKVVL